MQQGVKITTINCKNNTSVLFMLLIITQTFCIHVIKTIISVFTNKNKISRNRIKYILLLVQKSLKITHV